MQTSDVTNTVKNVDDKTPVQILHELLGPGELEFKDCESMGEQHKKIFKVSLTYRGQQFEGSGTIIIIKN